MSNVVYTGGTFDLLHIGHLELLEACRRMAGHKGFVVVGLNTDAFIERFKGKPPFQSYAERRAMLLGCRYVDYVIDNHGQEDSTKTIDGVGSMYQSKEWTSPKIGKVNIVAIGTDWAPPRDYYAQMGFTKEWLDERGIVLVYVDRRTGESSSSIKERMKDDRG